MKTILKNQNKYYQELGKISSHILHDIINPITGLILYLDMISDGKDNNLRNFIVPIKDTSGTVKEFIKYIDDHLNSPNETQIINMEKIVLKTINLFKPKALKNKVSFYFFRNSNRNLIVGNPLKFFQVLLNLISNSIDSFEKLPGERKNIINIIVDFSNGKIKLSVSDNGCGIELNGQSNFFENSFSTKEHGCGIGLKNSYLILKNDFDAEVILKSKTGVGTCFEITFPERRIVN